MLRSHAPVPVGQPWSRMLERRAHVSCFRWTALVACARQTRGRPVPVRRPWSCTWQAFVCMAFAVEAVLMGTHTKHEPLDSVAHVLFFYAVVLCVVMVGIFVLGSSWWRAVLFGSLEGFFAA
jgi:hypothetical protein